MSKDSALFVWLSFVWNAWLIPFLLGISLALGMKALIKLIGEGWALAVLTAVLTISFSFALKAKRKRDKQQLKT